MTTQIQTSSLAAKLLAAVEGLAPTKRPSVQFRDDLQRVGPALAAAVLKGVTFEQLTSEVERTYGHRLQPDSLRKQLAPFVRKSKEAAASAAKSETER
jgi:hypothetical protein